MNATRAIVALTAGVLATVLGCGDSGLEPGNALTLSVAVTRPVIEVGDSTVVTITLRNRAPVPITVDAGGCVLLPYVALESTDEIVYPPGGHWICAAVLRRLTLAPGSEKTQQLVVYGGGTGTAGRVGLAPGLYTINATLQSSEFPLQAAPVRLTVE